MDKGLIEKYKQQLLEMRARAVMAPPFESAVPPDNSIPIGGMVDNGKIIGEATVIRQLYPLPNTEVSVFTGGINNMQILDTALTDSSGRTRPFTLPAPNVELSLEKDNTLTPYSLYGIRFRADGYLDNYHINIPVFSGQTAIVSSPMMLKETAGKNKEYQIFDEAPNYQL